MFLFFDYYCLCYYLLIILSLTKLSLADPMWQIIRCFPLSDWPFYLRLPILSSFAICIFLCGPHLLKFHLKGILGSHPCTMHLISYKVRWNFKRVAAISCVSIRNGFLSLTFRYLNPALFEIFLVYSAEPI